MSWYLSAPCSGSPVRNGDIYSLLLATMGLQSTSETSILHFWKSLDYFSHSKRKIAVLLFGYGWVKSKDNLFCYQREENRWWLDFEYAVDDNNIVCKQTCHKDFSVNWFPHEYVSRYLATLKHCINLIPLKWESFLFFSSVQLQLQDIALVGKFLATLLRQINISSSLWCQH